MSRNAGVRTLTCPYCWNRYVRTNWMKCHDGGRDNDGHLLDDTHLIGCFRRQEAKKKAKATLGRYFTAENISKATDGEL
jgi:hypothetical protein